MKRSLHIICLICAGALIGGMALLSPLLPADGGVYVEKKYAGWSGVLRGWVASNWSCAGSFNAWLNRCAGEFEMEHEGVYLEFTSVEPEAMENLAASGLRAPELLFFSPGIFTEAEQLAEWTPVCMGGYARVENPSAANLPEAALPDDAGRSFHLAVLGLRAPEEGHEIALPESALDLGLPTLSQIGEISLDSFLRGELKSLVVSQRELARLIALREQGRGPDWRCAAADGFMLADQLLIGAAVRQEDARAGERTPLAQAFLQHLLSAESQRALSAIGAFSVTDQQIYPAASSYAQMEALIQALPRIAPDFFSTYPAADFEDIVRNYAARLQAQEPGEG